MEGCKRIASGTNRVEQPVQIIVFPFGKTRKMGVTFGTHSSALLFANSIAQEEVIYA